MKGLIGKKAGMTQIITEFGHSLPTTVINIKENIVTQVKTKEKHGYNALQVSMTNKKINRTTKALKGHFKKAKTSPKKYTKEIRGMVGFELGQAIKISDVFKPGEFVDVTGTSKGKGFAGVIKRHNNSIGPKSHGSQFHRQIGSMGDIEGNHIYKGKKMPGQMGSVKRTVQNLEILSINDEQNYLLVKGAIPGPNNSLVIVKKAIKGIPDTKAVKLINLKEAKEKNILIEKASHLAVNLISTMSIEEMEELIAEAEAKKDAKESKPTTQVKNDTTKTEEKIKEETTKESKPDQKEKEKENSENKGAKNEN